MTWGAGCKRMQLSLQPAMLAVRPRAHVQPLLQCSTGGLICNLVTFEVSMCAAAVRMKRTAPSVPATPPLPSREIAHGVGQAGQSVVTRWYVSVMGVGAISKSGTSLKGTLPLPMK